MSRYPNVRAAADAAIDAILVARMQSQQNLGVLRVTVREDYYAKPVLEMVAEPDLRRETDLDDEIDDYMDHALAWLLTDDDDANTILRMQAAARAVRS